jgi:uncharacterized paraquat-inducible protein A
MNLANFFLHGFPKPPDEVVPVIRCSNTDCLNQISEPLELNGKKVCPTCKTVISESALEKLKAKTTSTAEMNKENQ